MAALQKESAGNSGISFVSFSVDPKFDTPAVLSGYAARYQADPARWHFLTGPTEKTLSVGAGKLPSRLAEGKMSAAPART